MAATIICVEEGKEHCEFCTESPTRMFKAQAQPIVIEFEGRNYISTKPHWLACPYCAECIENNSWSPFAITLSRNFCRSPPALRRLRRLRRMRQNRHSKPRTGLSGCHLLPWDFQRYGRLWSFVRSQLTGR
jgi:hypothetical protein